MKPDYVEAVRCLYWHHFHGATRKDTLRQMIACGLTARQAIEEIRSYEREP